MKKNVLYSLAALSALPMGASATVINVPANKSVSLAEEATGVSVNDDMVFTSTDGNKVVIEVAKKGGLYPGRYLLKAVISNGESNNQLTVKYSVNDGDFVTSSVEDLATGVEVNVSSILKSRIVLTVEDENVQKAPFTVGGISLDLQFDFDAVYTKLNTIYDTYLSENIIGNFTHYANVKATDDDDAKTNGERLSDIKESAEDWADDTQTANYSQKNQNYETYVAQKLYGLFKNETYSEADDDWNKLDLVKSYKIAAMQLLADIKAAENAGRSEAALQGYTSLWEALKEEYRTVQEVVGNHTTTREYGDKGVDEDGTLRQEIKGIADEAYGKGELVSTMDDLRTEVKNMKADIDALDEAFKSSIDSEDPLQTEVQDYSNLSFDGLTAQYEALDADVTKVKENYSGYTADTEAYKVPFNEVTSLAEEVEKLTAGVDVSIADKQEIDADLKDIQDALTTYKREMGNMHVSYSYYEKTVNPQKHDKTIDDIEALITALNGKIATKKTAYASTREADEEAVTAVGTMTGTLTEELDGANTAIGKIAEIIDGEDIIYKASNYADDDAIKAAIAKITTDAGAVEHAAHYEAKNSAENTPKSKFMYVYDEASFNEAYGKGYYEKYYKDEKWQTEDYPQGLFAAHDKDKDGKISWAEASEGLATEANSQYPYLVIGLDKYTGKVQVKYGDNEAKVWPEGEDEVFTDKDYLIVSVVKDLGLDEFNMVSGHPKNFDPSKLTITLLGTGKQVVEDYGHAVERIQNDIADYQQLAEESKAAFATEWEKYTQLVDKFEADLAEVEGDGYDYTAEKDEIAADIANVKAKLTTAASTSNKGDAHKAAVDAIDIDNAVTGIKADIEEVKFMVDAARTAAEQLRQRNEARAAVDLILATINIDELDAAFDSESAQGADKGSQVGIRLKEAYEKWIGIYTNLYNNYELASGKDAEAAIAAYNELKQKDGVENDFNDVKTALYNTVFEGYEGTGEGQKGLIYALAQHKDGVQNNVDAKTAAYKALGYDENGDYDDSLNGSLAHELWQKADEAKTAVNAGVDTNPTDNQKFITADDKTKAVGTNETTGLIDTRVNAIKEQIAALKEKVDAAYGEEKLGKYWMTDHLVEGATEKAYTEEVKTLKALANDLLTRTQEWINATDLSNRQASGKAAASTASQTVGTELTNLSLGSAHDHYVGKKNDIWGYVDAISVLEVNDNIITNNVEWTDVNGTEKAKVSTIKAYTKDINGLPALAEANKTQFQAIYSGDNSTYNTVKDELEDLKTFINAQEDTPAKEALLEAYWGEDEEDEKGGLVKDLSDAESSITDNYANGKYENGESSEDYVSDKQLLTNISEAIKQAREAFDGSYSSDIANQNKELRQIMEQRVADYQARMLAAQSVLESYKAMTLTFNELMAVKDFELVSVNSMLEISSNIEQHVNACNTNKKLYQEGESSWETDNTDINDIATNLAEFYEKVAACNTALSNQWTALDKDIETVKSRVYGPFENFTKKSVEEKIDAAQDLLDAGNDAQSKLSNANTALDAEKTWAEQKEEVTAIVKAAKELATSIVNYNNEETGYAKLVADAKNVAAETDIKNKAANWRSENVTPVSDNLALDTPKFMKEKKDLLEGLDLTKTEEYNNSTKSRKEILQALFEVAIGTDTDNSIGKLDAAIEATDAASFYDQYNTLMEQYDALVLNTTDLESKIQAWKDADELYADIQAKVYEYVKLTSDKKLDENINTEDEDAPILNKQYLTEKTLIKGSLVENAETVTEAYDNLKTAIENFGKATYASVEAVTAGYTNSTAWQAAMNAAVSAEQTAISLKKTELQDYFDGTYKKNSSIAFANMQEVQSRINAINTSSTNFATLKGYEKEIVDLMAKMLNEIEGSGATVYAQLQKQAVGLKIDDQDVLDFLAYEDFGDDSYATPVKEQQETLTKEKTAIEAAIKALNDDFGTKYTEANILAYQEEIEGIIGDENSGLVKRIADLTTAVTETESVSGMTTPKEALADYVARKTANETAKTEIEKAIAAVEGELAAAVAEYPEIEDDIVIAFTSLEADYKNLDLVEKVNGKYQTKSTYDTTSLSEDIQSALYSARKTELTDYITEKQLDRIVSRVTTAITNKGLIGLAKKNLLEQANTYNATYATENAKITETLTMEVKESIKSALETLNRDVEELIASVATYSQPGDLTGSGEVGGTDFTRLKNIILGKNTMDDFNVTLENCDLNGDGKVGIGDLVILNNLQLGLNPDGTERNGTEWNARALNGGESLTTETIVTGENTRRIAISLANSREYVAFQVDMVLPEGMTLVGESLTDRARLQRLASNDLADGTHRIISVPVLNTTFKGNDGAMLYIDVETSPSYMGGDVELKSVVFTDALGQETEFSIASETTGIMDTLKSAAQTAKEAIYSVGGKMRDGLKKGINIIRRADGTTEKVIKK